MREIATALGISSCSATLMLESLANELAAGESAPADTTSRT
jgi:hypothetical protein